MSQIDTRDGSDGGSTFAEPLTLPDRPRILIVKMWAIGDILMATPLLRTLHRRYPGCSITWLVDKRYAAIVDGNPMIDHVIAFDNRLWQRLFRYGNLPAYLRMSIAMREDLKRRKFDVVINLTAEKWWAAWFQTAPRSIGLFPRAQPGYMGRLYTKVVPRPDVFPLHATVHYLMALEPLGIRIDNEKISIGETSGETEFIREFTASNNIDPNKTFVMITPRATEENRCLSESLCVELIRWLDGHCQATAILSGTPGDRANLKKIADVAAVRSTVVAVDTELREYVALIRRADLLITTDTSALHIAGGLGTPYLALFGPARPEERLPFGGNGIALDNPMKDPPCREKGCYPANCAKCTKMFAFEGVANAMASLLPAREIEDSASAATS